MLTNISWSNYSIAVGVILLVWYLFLGFRFYYEELKQLISGKQKDMFPFLGNENANQSSLASNEEFNPESSFSESITTRKEAEEL
jgi:hypothetical protein